MMKASGLEMFLPGTGSPEPEEDLEEMEDLEELGTGTAAKPRTSRWGPAPPVRCLGVKEEPRRDPLYLESAANCIAKQTQRDIELFEAQNKRRVLSYEDWSPKTLTMNSAEVTQMQELAKAAERLTYYDEEARIRAASRPSSARRQDERVDPPTPRPNVPFESLLRNAPRVAYGAPPPRPGSRVSSTCFQRPTSAIRRRPWSAASGPTPSFTDRRQRPPLPPGKQLFWEVRRPPSANVASRTNSALSTNMSLIAEKAGCQVAQIENSARVSNAAGTQLMEVSPWQPHAPFYPAFKKPTDIPTAPDVDEEGNRRYLKGVRRREIQEARKAGQAREQVLKRAAEIRDAHRTLVERAKSAADSSSRCKVSAAGRALSASATRVSARAVVARSSSSSSSSSPSRVPHQSHAERMREVDDARSVGDLPDAIEDPNRDFCDLHPGQLPWVETDISTITDDPMHMHR